MTYCMDDGPNPYGSLETLRAYRAELDLLPHSVMNKAELIERADWMIELREAGENSMKKSPATPASAPTQNK